MDVKVQSGGTWKHCFLAIFPKGGQIGQHCFLATGGGGQFCFMEGGFTMQLKFYSDTILFYKTFNELSL
jgi:hypothetical protein